MSRANHTLLLLPRRSSILRPAPAQQSSTRLQLWPAMTEPGRAPLGLTVLRSRRMPIDSCRPFTARDRVLQAQPSSGFTIPYEMPESDLPSELTMRPRVPSTKAPDRRSLAPSPRLVFAVPRTATHIPTQLSLHRQRALATTLRTKGRGLGRSAICWSLVFSPSPADAPGPPRRGQ